MVPGEIVGVAGISGNGQRELAETVYGARPPRCGEIFVDGARVTGKPPGAMLDRGVSYCSEDPITDSIVPGLTIREHMVLGGLPLYPRGLGIDWRKIETSIREVDAVAALRVAEPDRVADRLSGGNIQRMILARALSRPTKVWIVSYPTRGLDIATAKQTHQLILQARMKGTAILLISEDLNELFELSDRLLVLSQGRSHGPILPSETDLYEIGQLMTKGG
jgi:ABC-type uncharacterized transport system ATPase subunit